MLRKAALAVVLVLGAGLAAFLLGNWGGWRARVVARVRRVENYPSIVPAPAHFLPRVPSGFIVTEYAHDFVDPRWLAIAPDGDVFVSESAAGRIVVLHSKPASPRPTSREVFTDGLTLPFGVAFRGPYVYIANTNEVVRFKFDPATSKRLGNSEHVLDLPGYGYNQHWTRSIAFSADSTTLFASVGSQTNESIESDSRRAAILAADPDGGHVRVFATGLRNAVGLAINPETSELWASVNERDDIGDDVPDDYFTHVSSGGFYGWPYSFLGGHVDDRVSARPDLVATSLVPDVLLGAHVAPLQFAFYSAQQFPSTYWHGAFVAEHGSWNRRERAGYAVAFVPFRDGHPDGAQPFLSGFVANADGKDVYGRPVGLALLADGSLLVSDDGGKVIWRVDYEASASSLSDAIRMPRGR